MRTEGNSGSGGSNLQEFTDVLAGVNSDGEDVDLLPLAQCANPACGKWFRPRADGDIYHSHACDLDSNPQFRGHKGHSEDREK